MLYPQVYVKVLVSPLTHGVLALPKSFTRFNPTVLGGLADCWLTLRPPSA